MVSIDFLYLHKPVIDHGHIPDLSSNIKIPGVYGIFNRTVTHGKFRKFCTAMRGIFVCLLEVGNSIVRRMEVGNSIVRRMKVASHMLVITVKLV